MPEKRIVTACERRRWERGVSSSGSLLDPSSRLTTSSPTAEPRNNVQIFQHQLLFILSSYHHIHYVTFFFLFLGLKVHWDCWMLVPVLGEAIDVSGWGLLGASTKGHFHPDADEVLTFFSSSSNHHLFFLFLCGASWKSLVSWLLKKIPTLSCTETSLHASSFWELSRFKCLVIFQSYLIL